MQKTVGAVEVVDFPEFGLVGVDAKIDTGADTGALHCTKIRLETNTDGDFLYFSPFDDPSVEIMAEDFAMKVVRSSNGQASSRYFIKTKVVLQDESYSIVLSLADRTEMNWPVLIGRRFLKKNGFLVDVNKPPKVS